MNPKRLYRSRRDRMLAGVAGGMAEYLEIDPSVVRILWVLSIFLGGFSILLYIIMAFVIPIEPVGAPAPGPGQTAGPWWGSPSVGPAWGSPVGSAGPAPASAPVTAPAAAATAAPGDAAGEPADGAPEPGADEASEGGATSPAEPTQDAAGPAGASDAAWAANQAGPGWGSNPAWAANQAWAAPPPGQPTAERRPGRAGLYFGILLVVFGTIAAVNVLIPGLAASGALWAGLLVALGVVLLVGATRRTASER